MELNFIEFNLGEVHRVVIDQVMMLSEDRQVPVIYNSPADIATMHLFGDNLKLQIIFPDFFTNALYFTPVFEGSSIILSVTSMRELIGRKMHIVHLGFR